MKEGHGGVVIGSEISGSVKNVFAENCFMDSPNLDRALRFKTNSCRGGLVENVFFRKIKIGQVGGEIIRIDFYYGEGDVGKFTPVIRNIYFDNVSCNKSQYGIWIKAYKRSPVTNIRLSNCTFNNVEKSNYLYSVENISYKNVTVNGQLLKNR